MAILMWSKQQRLVFIETRLYWEGQLNRRDIESFFHISTPQASGDLKRYMELAPGNMAYDTSQKSFMALDSFSPKFISTEPHEYFAMLLLQQNEKFADQVFLSPQPSAEIIAFPQRRVRGDVLKTLLRSMKQGLGIEIHYQSMTDPDPHWRWITPHTLVSDGRRWHVRSFCHRRKTFRDFVLARILETADSRADGSDIADDVLWQTMVQIEIAPHEGLSDSQRTAVEFDYEMENGLRCFEIRASFLFYLKRLFLMNESHSYPRIVWKNETAVSALEKDLQQQAHNRYAALEKQEV